MAVTLDNLVSHWSGFQPEIVADAFFNFWLNVLVGTDGSGNFPNSNIIQCQLKSLNMAPDLLAKNEQFKSKSNRLSMDTVSTPNH